jgi:hypothetical protein
MSKEIVLDYNYLESMSGRFESVFEKADTASQYAERAERCCDGGSLYKYVVKLSESIRTSIRLILDSFTSTDQKMKEEAQKIVGTDIYNGIAGGGSAHYDANGNYTIDTKYDTYRKKVEALKGKDPSGVPQHYRDASSGNGKHVYPMPRRAKGDPGACTMCSNATLVNRRLALDGVVDSNGNRPYYSAEDAFYDHGGNSVGIAGQGGSNKYSVEVDGQNVATYSTSRINSNTIRNSGASVESKLIELLNDHPEGVQFYTENNFGPHGIVITSYSENPPGSGTYSYMAYDPVNGCEMPLTETYLYKNSSSKIKGSESAFINSCAYGLIYLN